MKTLTRTPLARTIAETPTDIWNDSCAIEELAYAIGFGAVGATANPTIVVDNWRREPAYWADRVRILAAEQPGWTERELAWAVVEEMSVRGAALLLRAFEAARGRAGRLSIQTDPTLYGSARRMVDQGLGFSRLAPNVIVKFPATAAGIAAIEEATYRGVSINATVSFSVGQAIAAAEAVERGLERRRGEGLDSDEMGPVITIMMGRLEDWLRVVADRDGIIVDPAALAWSGIAVFKRAHAVWRERGFRARLLGAAIRHHLHWSQLIGGDVIVTLPSAWQKRFNASEIEVRPRIDDPVEPRLLEQLRRHFVDFRRAYEPDGLQVAEFDAFPPSVRTLRAFIGSYHDLLHLISDARLPDPDKPT